LVVEKGNGAAYWIHRDGLMEPACSASGSSPIASAYSDGPHSAWTADQFGHLAHWDFDLLDPDLPCAVARTTSTSSAGEFLESIDGAPDVRAVELFGIGLSGQVHRFGAGRWEAVGAPLTGVDRIAQWMAPGRGFATTQDGPILWYTDGLVRTERLVIESTDTFVRCAKRFDDVGVVIGAKPYLLVFEDDAGRWQRVHDQTPTSDRVDAFARHGESYFMILNGGRIRELHPRRGYCKFQPLLPESASPGLVALEDGTLIGSSGAVQRIHPVRASTCQ
jgi:hypothetical protein